MSEVRSRELRSYVAELAGYPETDPILDGPLFASGVIDSLNLLDIVGFVERRWGIRVPAGDLTLEHWNSLSAMEAYAASMSAR